MGFLVFFFFILVGLEFDVSFLFKYPAVLAVITAIAFPFVVRAEYHRDPKIVD